MVKLAVLGIIGIFLAGCAGGREQACAVFSPAQIELPTTQDDQRIEENIGEPSGGVPQQRC